MGDEVKVTVIAAGFDRLDGLSAGRRRSRRARSPSCSPRTPPTRSTPTTTTTSTSRRSCADRPTVVAANLAAVREPDRRRRRRPTRRDPRRHQGVRPRRRRGRGRGRVPGDRRELRPGAGRPRLAPRPTAGVAVHFIGRLQSNKVRLLAGAVDVWETRRPPVAGRRARQAGAGCHGARPGQRRPASRARAGATRTTSPRSSTPCVDAGLDRRRADDGRADDRRRRRPPGPASAPCAGWSTSSACGRARWG